MRSPTHHCTWISSATARRPKIRREAALAPLKAAAEARGSTDFSSLWAGRAVALARAEPAAEITRRIAAEADALLRWTSGP